MTDTIQPLLDRIRSEGLQEAGEEREKILASAREEAAELLRQANAEAAALKAKAEEEAEQNRKRAITALQQAARDTLLRLRSELNRQLQHAAGAAARSTLSSPEAVASMLQVLLNSRPDTPATVETAPGVHEVLPALLKDLGRSEEGLHLIMQPDRHDGFQIRFEGDPATLEISTDTVAEWMSSLLRPELTALLAPPEA